MATTRRDFLRNSACALGGVALASSLETFGAVHALTPQAATDYRALVCVFLNGGNDGNNMFVSLDQYASYASARNASQLAIPQASFLPVSPVSGGSYGFHPTCWRFRVYSTRENLLCSATMALWLNRSAKLLIKTAPVKSRSSSFHTLIRWDCFRRDRKLR